MELYTAGTGNGQRAAIAVNECSVRCAIHVLNLAQGDQKKPDYLKLLLAAATQREKRSVRRR
jgi:hypothetical protein